MWLEPYPALDSESIARKLATRPGFVWLDAQYPSAKDGRYSFLACEPVEIKNVEYGEPEPYKIFDELRPPPKPKALRTELPLERIPYWIGYIAYDAYWSRPERGTARFDRQGEPMIWLARYESLVAFDHVENNCWLIGDHPEAVTKLKAQLEDKNAEPLRASVSALECDDAETHRASISKALDYIAKGEIYQVNLARRWSAHYSGAPFSIWQAMRQASPVPLGMFLDAKDHTVLACTMERFLSWSRSSGKLVTRPIKGTSAHNELESQNTEALQHDPKERAEHVMIVDLVRNDLGRVALPGSVSVTQELCVEAYRGLDHLVSTVQCTTRPNTKRSEVLKATFPPGSVTGTPKIRALEVIEELERHPRQIYCGAVGYVDRQGGLSLGVAIRTATIKENSIQYWAGGGIVEASIPEKEVAETELKARVFLDAIEALSE